MDYNYLAFDEDEQLEQERLRLKNTEELYQTVFASIENLYGASGSVQERLLEVKKNLENAGRIDAKLKAFAESLDTNKNYTAESFVEFEEHGKGFIIKISE